jgi:hypothetical protein
MAPVLVPTCSATSILEVAMATRKKQSLPKIQRKFSTLRGTVLVPPEAIAGIHPAVPSELYTDISFLIDDLSQRTLSALELSLRTHPIGVTPPDEEGKFHVISGLRAWQVYQVAAARALIHLKHIPLVVYPEAADATRIPHISIEDTFLTFELFSLSLSRGYSQLLTLQDRIPTERWQELFGRRARLEKIVQSPPPRTPTQTPPPGERRGRGRPRTRPIPSPDAVKRGPGRPRKEPILGNTSNPSGNQGSTTN